MADSIFDRGDDADDARQILVGTYSRPPARRVEQFANGFKLSGAKLQNEKASGSEPPFSLRDQRRIDSEAIFAGEERDARLVIADFALQRIRVAPRDIWWIADDDVKARGFCDAVKRSLCTNVRRLSTP